MTNEELLAELENLLRTMPQWDSLPRSTDEIQAWLGRTLSILHLWDGLRSISAQSYSDQMLGSYGPGQVRPAIDKFLVLLHQARHDLRMKTIGPTNVAVSGGMVFDYFEEIRQKIEPAETDILFVDPYLDAEFVTRYLPHIKTGVRIRLLAQRRIPTLVPAIEAFAAQENAILEIRPAPDFHDRYVFINENEGYQSGASFKDGARNSPTTISQITDAFSAVFQTYQDIWNGAEVKYPRP